MPANPPSPDKGGRELSRPRHADRSARARVALRKSAIRTVATATLLAALHWGIPYLRHQPELSVPAHSTIDGLLAVCRAGLAIFLLTELSLLTGAVLTIRRPELHLRFLNLMLFWSYVLVAPYLLIKSRRPPQRFLLTDVVVARPARTLPPARPSARGAATGLPSRGTSRPGLPSATLEGASPAGSVPAAGETYLAKVTREDYRRALQLLLQHTQILQQDRELLDLLLRQLTEPGPDVPGTGNGVAHAEVLEPGPARPPAAEPPGPSTAAALPAAAEPPPDKVRGEEYRQALLVLLRHTEVLHGDRQLLDLLLAQLTETRYDERIVELAQVGRVRGTRRSSFRCQGPAAGHRCRTPGAIIEARRSVSRSQSHVTRSAIPGRTLNHGTFTAAAPSSYER
jgi:hypothetical protein